MMKKSSLFLGMLSLIVITGCSWWTKNEEAQTPATEVEASATAAEATSTTTEGGQAPATIKAVEASEELKNVIAGEKPVVVKFYADWCGVCKEMEAAFNEVATSYADKCEFVTINIDKAKDLANEQNIKGVPTVVIFKKGQELDRTTGKMSKEELEIKVKETWEEENNQ